MTYYDLVKYVKENHVSWSTDLFDVLRGFFGEYCQPLPPRTASQDSLPSQMGDSIIRMKFREPEKGEYTPQDLMDLFST